MSINDIFISIVWQCLGGLLKNSAPGSKSLRRVVIPGKTYYSIITDN